MPNTAQIEYWNAEAGRKWVDSGERLDRQMAPLTELLLSRATPRPGEAALDVGCGAGDTTVRLARALAPDGRVLGIDISEPMLAAARRRGAEARLAGVAFARADAQDHGFEPASFDLVFSRFGVMFFEDPVAAFANLLRAARPGGRLCFACWGPLAENPWFALPLAAAAERLGPPDPQPPHAPGPLAFSDVDYLGDVLRAAGWADVAIARQSPPMAGAGSAEEEAAFMCRMGPAARLIAERKADEATVAAIRAVIADRLAAFAGPDGIRVPLLLHYVDARRPVS